MAKLVEIRKKILKKNDDLAQSLRRRFAASGTLVVNLVASPGTGKTELLRYTMSALKDDLRIAAIVGDLETDNDARRLRESGAPAHQIETHGACHLESFQIDKAVNDAAEKFGADDLDILFIENIGNLVCTASFDLGEDIQVVMVSTTEGEDKPLKYPTIFNRSDVCIVTKMDLSDALGYDRDRMLESIASVKPGMRVFETSARTGQGMDEWLAYVRETAAAKRNGCTDLRFR
jgi:hydrogenase nickel incorporation protein HypB